MSNYTPLLDEIDSSDRETQHPSNLHLKDTVTALGRISCPSSDTFQFKLNLPDNNHHQTKRNILSYVAKLFDPLGLLAQIIIGAKILTIQLIVLHVELTSRF